MLRAYFRHNRTLMGDLWGAAYRAVARFVEKAAGPGARPAMVVVKHTFGEGVRFHPHLHAVATAGGWDGDQTWRPLPAWDTRAIRGLFEIKVFRFLRGKDLLSRERMDLIRSWPHSGFNVHVSKAIPAGERVSLARLARYKLRAPLMLSRIASDRDRVTVRVEPHGSRVRKDHRARRARLHRPTHGADTKPPRASRALRRPLLKRLASSPCDEDRKPRARLPDRLHR